MSSNSANDYPAITKSHRSEWPLSDGRQYPPEFYVSIGDKNSVIFIAYSRNMQVGVVGKVGVMGNRSHLLHGSINEEPELLVTAGAPAPRSMRWGIWLFEDFFDFVALALDVEVAGGGLNDFDTLEVEVFNGSIFNVVDNRGCDACYLVNGDKLHVVERGLEAGIFFVDGLDKESVLLCGTGCIEFGSVNIDGKLIVLGIVEAAGGC